MVSEHPVCIAARSRIIRRGSAAIFVDHDLLFELIVLPSLLIAGPHSYELL